MNDRQIKGLQPCCITPKEWSSSKNHTKLMVNNITENHKEGAKDPEATLILKNVDGYESIIRQPLNKNSVHDSIARGEANIYLKEHCCLSKVCSSMRCIEECRVDGYIQHRI